jgi:hypothetical protein
MNVALNITGGSYQSRSLPLSAQVTKNFYPELLDNKAVKSEYVLHSFPGLTVFCPLNGDDRGMFEAGGFLYKVQGTILYKIDQYANVTALGTIPGTGYCIFSQIITNILMVTDGRVFIYNQSGISEVTDPDLETPNSLAFLNNQIIYDGDDGRFVTSDVGDGSAINALNYATAESHPDSLVRVYVFNQTLYLFGEKSIEPWYNSGSGNPPFDRLEGGIIQTGLAAVYSVANNDQYIYHLGDDSHVYRMTGSQNKPITTIGIAHAFENYDVITDAIGFCFSMEGQNFYYLTFPTENKSWCYSENADIWFELSRGVNRYRATSYAFAFRKHLVADNQNIYQVSLDAFTDAGEPILRVRDTGPLHGGLFRAPGKELEMNRFELIMETGTGLLSGQGFDPKIMLSFSDDGGKTFSTEMWGQIGQMGQGIFKVEWSVLGSFFSRIIRVQTSDPVFYSIHSASADIEVCI